MEYRVGKNEEIEDYSLGSEEDIGILGIYLVNKIFLEQLETLCKAKDVYTVEKFLHNKVNLFSLCLNGHTMN